jgi:hypothetical protein
MEKQTAELSKDVSAFLDAQHHPLREEIEQLRHLILSVDSNLTETIKWNGPNYCVGDEDRLTMKIQPPKNIQLIFHRGAKKQTQPKDRLVEGSYNFLVWKENDRAIATFRNRAEIQEAEGSLKEIVKKWIEATT